jgi:hypothetical protein
MSNSSVHQVAQKCGGISQCNRPETASIGTATSTATVSENAISKHT